MSVWGSPARARTASAQAFAEDELEEVVITGSHIARSTINTPSPITVIDSQAIEDMGLTSAGDVINQLTQNSNFTSSANLGQETSISARSSPTCAD